MSLIEVKKAFFDQKKVLAEAQKTRYSVLSKLGAFIRRTIQFSMKSKKGPSDPGIPPHAHGDKLLRKHTYFYLDRQTSTLVVGPIKLQTKIRKTTRTVPNIEEFGGTVQIQTRKGVIVKRYPPRPYVAPAAVENMSKLRELVESVRNK